jgi:tetratricopeptide (TPR) repeat protein
VTPEHTQQLNVKNIPASMKRSSISVTRFVSKRNSDTNDDDNSKSSDDSDYNKLGETFSRATKFLGTIVKGQNSNGDSYHDSNLDIDQYLNERYKEVNDYNLYNSFRRESGATKTNNYSKDDNMATVDDADSDDASRVTMPPLDEGDLGDIAKAEENDRGSVNDGIKPFAGISPPRWVSDVLSQSAEIVATESTARRRSSEISSGYSNPLAQSCVVVDTGSTARRRSSEISSGYSNPLTQSFVNVGARSTAARRSSEISSGYSNPLAQSCVIVDTGSTARRRSSEISSGYSNQLTQSFVNVGARSTAGRRSSEISSGLKNSVWSYAAGDSMSASATLVSSGGMDSSDPLLIDHHAKSRASFVRRNMSQAATGTQSFRDVQQLMKDKGAVTGNAIRYMLQEAAEEHAAKNVTSVFDESEPSTQQTPRFNGVDTGNYCSDNNYLGDAVSKIEERSLQQHEAQQLRLERDPMFGKLSDTAIRPYISIPSRESKVETFMVLLRNVADYGESRLLTVHGTKFVGKTKLIKHVIDTVQSQGLGYTVLSSVRSANDILTSFFCFREITSAALRACDSVTESFDENNDLEQAGDIQRELKGDEEDDELKLILERLKSRKILNKSDQLMISRILPAVMDDQLLSLLKGRNPTALIKDIAASLFKILIPLQPFCFVFEADGDDCDIDPSSWHLIEEMLLSAGTQCPQMLMIAISRHSLLDHVPPSIIATQFVNIHIEKMDKCDTACYIRALFCDANIDRNMQIDPHVADAVYHRANGCPLFTERIVLWSQGKDLIELDETRNAVALNLPTIVRNDHEHGCDSSNHEMLLLKTLPANLNEEILEKINNLPHQVLDALKIAAQIGITFDVDKYSSLCLHGFHDSLQELITSHGIFYKTNGHCYRWRHVAVYEAVLTIIISNERFEIQGRIADSLQDLPLSRICNNGVQYARHYALAERWDEAFDRYMEAGDEAEKKHDFAGAVGIYQQAKICLTKTRNNPSLQRRLSPHAALGLCLRELMRYDDAEAELEFCLSQIMTVPEYLRNAEIELEVVTTLAMLKQYQSKYSEALAMYARALPLARANKERHSEVWLAHHVASCAEIHRKAGDLLQAKTLHMEALAYRELAVKEKSCTNLELAISFTQLGCTMSGLGDNLCAFNLHKKALAARVDHLDFYHSLVSES